MQTHRIDTYISETEHGPRDAVGVTRTKQGDIVFEFADGWRMVFYPCGAPPETPDLRRVRRVYTYSGGGPSILELTEPREALLGKCLRMLPPDQAAPVLAAVREEGAATREAVTGGFRGLLEKVGLVRKRQRFPRVSQRAQHRAAELWRAWPGVCLDVGAGAEKVDCYDYHKVELTKAGITSADHLRAVLDSARK